MIEENKIIYFYNRLRSIYSPTVPLPIPLKKYMRALICYEYIKIIRKEKRRKKYKKFIHSTPLNLFIHRPTTDTFEKIYSSSHML